MKILVWGLGYVGTVVAGCFSEMGHEVVGVDSVQEKVDAINGGLSPIKEPDLDDLIRRGVAAGRLRAVTDGIAEVAEADVSLICVGTPSAADGATDLTYVRSVATDIGKGLRATSRYHVVIMRSTVFPGTTQKVVLPILEHYGRKKGGQDFGLVMNPEFLRETTAIADFYDPPYTVVGQLDGRSGTTAMQLYDGIPGDRHFVDIETAELLKQTCNAFHAMKISFANEIGRLGAALNVDSTALMELVCADTKLNISPAYLKPGFAFGGSCLPKDVRSILHHSTRLGVNLPLLGSLLPSNGEQIEAARVKINELKVRRVAVLGLSFKANTDDLRESPMLSLIQKLWQDNLEVTVYDPDVQLDRLMGGNLHYLSRHLPQIREIACTSLQTALEGAEVVVVTQNRPMFTVALRKLPSHVAVLDLMNPRNSYFPSSTSGLVALEPVPSVS